MKTNKILIIFFSMFILSLVSCEEKVLDKPPSDSFSDTDVWKDLKLAKMFANSTYNGLYESNTDWSFTNGNFGFPGSDADILLANYGGGGQAPINQGDISPDYMGGWSSIWSRKYSYIRRCNIFLSHIDDLPAENLEEKMILKGEMKYLRVHLYFHLTRYFGGVPLITKPFELDDDFQVARNSYEECVDWMVSELDEARELITRDRTSDEFGKASKAACLALKSQILLYANSKLHDPSTEPNGPLYDYAKNTWQEVANSAKAVIDDPDYELVTVNDYRDYGRIFYEVTPEIIFAKPNNPDYGTMCMEYFNGPPGQPFLGWGNNVPMQNFVDDFEMTNGLGISEPGSGYDPSPESIYANREMRFYANVLFQGADFGPRKMDYAAPDGMDFPANVPCQEDGSRTGYNIRKFFDENIDTQASHRKSPQIYLRLANMYLNYAEAQYFMDNEPEARKYINIIRNRVHLPPVTSTGEELFKDIQHERKIELAMEHHRFFDVRRWMIADQTGNIDVMGIEWKRVDGSGNLDPDGSLSYSIFKVEERHFYPRNYYLPIPRSEIERSELEQNEGYQ